MFTVEFDEDETLITIMDTTGELEDVSALLYEDYCHIRQWNEKRQRFDVVTMKPEMYYKLIKTGQCTKGTFILEKNAKQLILNETKMRFYAFFPLQLICYMVDQIYKE